MKKVMIVIAAIAVAAVTQAATYSWALTGASDYTGKNAYTFDSGNRIAIIEALTAGGDGIQKTIEGFATSGPKVASGRAGKEQITGSANLQDGLSEYGAFFILFDGDIADGNTYSISENFDVTASVSQTGSGGKDAFSRTAASTFTTTGQKIGGSPVVPPVTPDVPEPTSGLLLAIGGAALALRRKQK